MTELSDEQFQQLVTDAIDAIPEKYGNRIENLAFVVEDDPSPEQRQKLKLRQFDSLFGLYEGVPLTRRAGNYSFVLPDKITIFKNPILHVSHSLEQAREQVNHTIWHEVAHYFGLDHQQMHDIIKRNKKD